MRPVLHAALLLLIPGLACSEPPPSPSQPPRESFDWATTPTGPSGSGECPEGYAPPTLCEYLWSHEAFAIAEIEGVAAVWEPLRAEMTVDQTATVVDAEPEACTLLYPSIELSVRLEKQLAGPTDLPDSFAVRFGGVFVKELGGGQGIATEYPSTVVTWADGVDRFEAGTRILLPLFAASGEDFDDFVVVTTQLPTVLQGALQVPDRQEACGAAFPGNGMAIASVQTAAASCSDSAPASGERDASARRARPADHPTLADAAYCDAALPIEGSEGEGEGEGEGN